MNQTEAQKIAYALAKHKLKTMNEHQLIAAIQSDILGLFLPSGMVDIYSLENELLELRDWSVIQRVLMDSKIDKGSAAAILDDCITWLIGI